MARPLGPDQISAREWELRQQIRARVRELLGEASSAELARRLSDESRTRAHKILNPDRSRGIGQSITYTLIEDLARALTDGSVIDFLAPILGQDDARALEQAAHQRLVDEIARYERIRLEEWRRSVDREDVQSLLQDILNTAPLMTEPELGFLRQLLFGWKTKFGLPRSIRPTWDGGTDDGQEG